MALAELFTSDRATTVVLSGGTTAPAGGTQETWTVASSSMFGAAATGVSQFHVADPAAPSEIIAVTNVSGTTWTVTRGAESTTPVAHSAGFTIQQVVTAGFLAGLGTGGGSGTVTSVSVASANGFAGTVANPSSTPAISVSTPVTGLLKGNGTAVSAAAAGTDYAPATSGTAILKGSGSGGFSPAAAGTDYLAPAGNGSQLTGITESQVGSLTSDLAARVQVAGDLGGTATSPQVTGTHLASALPVNQGGTGSTTRNFAGLLTPVAVKTTTYTAAAGDFVPCDTTSGGFTVTLPNAPADLAVVGVKQVIQGGTNAVTIACAGSDVFNKAGGATSGTLTLLAQGMLLQYKASGAIWYVVADDLPLSQLDARYLALSGGTLTGSLTVGGALTTTPVTLTDAATITVNAAQSDYFRVTLGGNRTLGAPSNPADGQPICFEIIQDGTGSRTLAYNAVYSFPSSIGTPVLSTTAGFHDFLAFRYDSAATTWYCVGFVPQSTAAVPATVAQGGTGQSSLTAYALLAGGTTSTGALQQVSGLGSSGQILTSAGASALPAWQPLDGTASDIQPTGIAASAGATGKPADAGHVHANTLALPSDFGWVAWTADPGYARDASALSASIMLLTRFFIRQATTLNNVSLHVATAPAGTMTSGQNFACVYDSGGTQRAITADQATAWGTSGVKAATAFTSPYSAPAGWYYLVLNVVFSGGNGPAFRSTALQANAFLANAGLSAATLRCATQAAVAGTPGALTLSSNVQTNAVPVAAAFA